LKAEGLAIVYISHRMAEVYELSERVSVLRDGTFVGTLPREEIRPETIVRMMVGRDLSSFYKKEHAAGSAGRPVLEVAGISDGKRVKSGSFTVHAGEVLGLAGLVGAGRTEIAETIFGLRRRDAGTVHLGDDDISASNSHDIIRKGLVYAPEDRAKHGAVLPMTITENLTSGLLERVKTRMGLLSQSDEDRIGAETVARYRVRCAGTNQTMRQLSGGNQQKVVFGKWMGIGPDVAILDEPTRGVDVGAKDEIYELIDGLAREGMGILVISSELEELVRLCDRILSVFDGRIVAELAGDEITPERVSASYLTSAEASGR
jgi:ABC-type sugar transport system ATPase subunit